MDDRERKLERWLAANVREQPLAIILGATWNGLSFARSLGRRRIPVLLLESTRFLGSYTRYGKLLVLPHLEDDPQGWIRILRFVGARLTEPGALMPTGDEHTLLVSQHEQELSPCFRFVVPACETVEQIVNKRLQYAIAQKAGIPVPNVHFPESAEEVRKLSAELSFPCLLKPYTSHVARKALGQKVVVARSAGELITGYERLAARDVPAMIQEIVPGEDRALFGYLALWDTDGQEVAWLTKQKLRQNPPRFGDGSLQMTVEAPQVADLSRRLLRAFDYRGFVGVEFKLDARSGKYHLMEINPRTVSGNQMAISAGVDFPWIGYRYLTAAPAGAESTRSFRPGVKYLNEELDVLAFAALRRSDAMTIGQWIRSLRGTTARAVGAWDDPLPFVVGLWRFVSFLYLAASDAASRRRRARSGPRGFREPAGPG